MSVTAIQVQRVGAGAGDTAACQVIADAINTGTGVISAVTAPAVLTGSTLSIRAATNAVSGSASAAQITALEAATAALAKLKTGTVTIATGDSAGSAAMGAATWNAKPVVVTLQSTTGDGKIAAAVPFVKAVIAASTLTVTLLDKDGVATANAGTGNLVFSYLTNAN